MTWYRNVKREFTCFFADEASRVFEVGAVDVIPRVVQAFYHLSTVLWRGVI